MLHVVCARDQLHLWRGSRMLDACLGVVEVEVWCHLVEMEADGCVEVV